MHATTPSLTIPKDIIKLKKHISSLVDRLNKGGHLSVKAAAKVESEDQLQGTSTETEIQEEDTDTPLGSRFGERKSASGDRARRSALRERNVKELSHVIENTPTNISGDVDKAVIEGPKDVDDIDDDDSFF
ncbi:uncharacterized protein LOC106477445 [Limulus polyphemus]|uniref:Uncharacterized protein LOC106477445 n=1 Tax=Limulus polyphemus TaxID=6850 RepID=A0ABM1C3D8_LIMPO|nr:uncharacterized protein LOC106477445 [Limulus polyphemus]